MRNQHSCDLSETNPLFEVSLDPESFKLSLSIYAGADLINLKFTPEQVDGLLGSLLGVSPRKVRAVRSLFLSAEDEAAVDRNEAAANLKAPLDRAQRNLLLPRS